MTARERFEPKVWERTKQSIEELFYRFRAFGNHPVGGNLISRMMKRCQRSGYVVLHGLSLDVCVNDGLSPCSQALPSISRHWPLQRSIS